MQEAIRKMQLKPKYEFKLMKINSINISLFNILKFARSIKDAKLKSLKKNLRAGIHFDVPIVLAVNGSTKVIDGQHRLMAIQQMIQEDPDFEIEVLVVIYKDVNLDQIRVLFKRWNIGAPQTTDDFIQMFADEIEVWKLMDKEFVRPVSIYRKAEQFHFKKLVGGYIAASLNQRGGFSTTTNENFVSAAQQLTVHDYNILNNIMTDFMENIPTLLDRGNIFGGGTCFNSMMYVYYQLVIEQGIKSEIFWTRWKRYVMSDQQFVQICLAGGVQPVKIATNLTIELMNREKPYLKI